VVTGVPGSISCDLTPIARITVAADTIASTAGDRLANLFLISLLESESTHALGALRAFYWLWDFQSRKTKSFEQIQPPLAENNFLAQLAPKNHANAEDAA
jgi:hypothetical protein